MPSTINGIGTHYYGSRNRTSRKGTCPNCGHESELTSYDTWHCACFVFIPLFPIGRRRIIDRCSTCTSHVMMTLNQWNDMVQLALPAAFERYDKEVNLQTTIEAHAALLGVRNFSDAETFRSEAILALPNHVAELKSLFGWQMLDFREHKLAKELFTQAIEIDDQSQSARAGIALYDLNDGDIETALQRMSFLEEKGSGGDPYFHLLEPLIQACVDHGRFEDGLRLSNHTLAENPEAAQSDAFRKRHRLLQKRCGVREKNLPSQNRSLLTAVQSGGQNAAPWKRYTIYSMAGAFLLTLTLLAANWYSKNNRVVHVLCGEDAGLQLIIDDGEPIELSTPHHEIRLPEGAHKAVLRNPSANREITTDFKVNSSFPKRLISPRVWVFNAAGLHSIAHVRYARFPQPPRYQTHGRFGIVSHDEVDYPFVDPPEKMSLKKNGGVVTKKVLVELPVSLDVVARTVQDAVGPREAFEVAAQYLTLLPSHERLPQTLVQLAYRTEQQQRARELAQLLE